MIRTNDSAFKGPFYDTISDIEFEKSVYEKLGRHPRVAEYRGFRGGYKNYVRNFEDFVGRNPWAKESCAQSFIGGLQCPDLVLCGCVPGSNRESLAKAFLAVISAALQVKIVSCWPNHYPIHMGHGFNRTCRVEFRVDPSIDFGCKHTAYSMIEDQSGRALIEEMNRQKEIYSAVPIKEISWWLQNPEEFDTARPSYEDFACYNEWREGGDSEASPHPTHPAHLKGLNVYSVCVNKPQQMVPALELLNRALDAAPFTAEPLWTPFNDDAEKNPTSVHSARLKKYVGVDAEFIKVGLTKSEREAEFKKYNEGPKADWEFSDPPSQNHVDIGATEDLASVLTIAVDRHVVFSFFLLDMLQNPESGTAQAISALFDQVIFNESLIKIWFRYRSDIKVLDATIAHLFQGTPRAPYKAIPEYHNETSGPVIQTFKIKSPHYNGIRPLELEFSNYDNVPCIFHLPGTNDQGMHRTIVFSGDVLIDLGLTIPSRDRMSLSIRKHRYRNAPGPGLPRTRK